MFSCTVIERQRNEVGIIHAEKLGCMYIYCVCVVCSSGCSLFAGLERNGWVVLHEKFMGAGRLLPTVNSYVWTDKVFFLAAASSYNELFKMRVIKLR